MVYDGCCAVYDAAENAYDADDDDADDGDGGGDGDAR